MSVNRRSSALRLVRVAAVSIVAATFAVDAAPPADTFAQRMLACTGCHDNEGRRGRDAYYPRIAGKPAAYLYNQLVNFRDGRRFYALMTYLVDLQTDAYLREMAEHFASQKATYPPPEVAKVEPAVLDRGRALVQDGDAGRKLPACAECHGGALTGMQPAVPGLLGLPRDYIVAQLNAWRNGTRRALPPDCMGDIANGLTVEEIAAVAAWLGTQPVPPNPQAEPARRLPRECGGIAGVASK
jgi:cytochrome c553